MAVPYHPVLAVERVVNVPAWHHACNAFPWRRVLVMECDVDGSYALKEVFLLAATEVSTMLFQVVQEPLMLVPLDLDVSADDKRPFTLDATARVHVVSTRFVGNINGRVLACAVAGFTRAVVAALRRGSREMASLERRTGDFEELVFKEFAGRLNRIYIDVLAQMLQLDVMIYDDEIIGPVLLSSLQARPGVRVEAFHRLIVRDASASAVMNVVFLPDDGSACIIRDAVEA